MTAESCQGRKLSRGRLAPQRKSSTGAQCPRRSKHVKVGLTNATDTARHLWMEAVTLFWSFSATVAMTLAVLCALVWLIERQDRASLMLCILGLATAASAYVELGMMHSATPGEYGEWLRWYHLPVFLALMAQLLFVRYYLGTGREWLMGAFILARSAVLVVNFSVHPNFNFESIVSLRTVPLFGEQVSQIAAAVPRREGQLFAVASLMLLMAYLIDAAVRRWLTG